MKKGRLVVGVSGGKDSTATCLHLINNLGYKIEDFDRVFLDTGWEDKQTYEYLSYLEKFIGPIKRLSANIKIKRHHKDIEYFENKLGHKSNMVRLIFEYENFPRNFMKWCTRQLKMEPLNKYFDGLDYEYISVTGIRREESVRRSKFTEWEWNEGFDCWAWRPILDWTEKQVIDIHHEYDVLPNNLYLNGFSRVGCYPCIHARKAEIRSIDKNRISLIKEIETRINIIRKGKEKAQAGFFKAVDRNALIDDIVDWANTARGGKQLLLFNEPRTCQKWGLCEVKK